MWSFKKVLLIVPMIAITILLAIPTPDSQVASSITGNSSQITRQVLASVSDSYQAMDSAMNANAVMPNPHAVLTAQELLHPTQARVDSSVAGVFLYRYDLYRVSVFRSWAALHARDYSIIHVWSTFNSDSVTISGSQATVKGVETLHIDATIQNNGQAHNFSANKEAMQDWLKQAGLYLNFGQTNQARALIEHAVTLNLANNGWLIEKDSYWDPLAQSLTANHQFALTPAQISANSYASRKLATRRAYDTYSYTYNRQQAISYADSWWNSCNPNYSCYEIRDEDCANFVSQALYDGSGGNLPGDDSWHASSTDFIRAGSQSGNLNSLYNYLTNSPYGSTYNYAAANYSSYDYGTAAYYDDWYEYPGDLIFYDWGNVFGYGNADGEINHVAISVSQDANGWTYEDAHTANLYHYPWDLGGGSQTGYYFVVMNDNGYSTWPQ